MKTTQITDLTANIKHSFVSFFSILMFSALDVGVFVKSADAVAIIAGILGSALLAIIALHRINKFDLTDINRF